jgi:voltage-gated potassium channel Kch
MSKGTVSLIFLLSIITLILIIIAGIAVILVERAWANDSLPFAVWKSFTLTLDPGNLAGVEGSVGLIVVAALSTLGGIFITSTLISILNTGLANRLDNFQRGNAKIIEANHTIILGYSESVFEIISELQIANMNKKSSCIVVLGNEDKHTMEEQIFRHVPFSKSCKIICRSGDTSSAVDLERCSIETSMSVIINLTEDHEVIRTMLAVSTYLTDDKVRGQFPESQKIHISASIKEQNNIDVARIAGQGFAEVLHFKSIISRIMAHVCYQPGLSSVYTELFNFSGNDIYIEAFPQLADWTFHDANLAFPNSTVIGVYRKEKCMLNPDPKMYLEKEDCLILIAEDDNVSHPSLDIPRIELGNHTLSLESFRQPFSDNLLILGNSELLLQILNELDHFLTRGSIVTLAGNCKNGNDHDCITKHKFENIVTECVNIEISDRTNLENLLSRGIEHVLILSDSSLPPEQADAMTLMLLLQMRDWKQKSSRQFSITSEMVDVRNRKLAQVTNVNDFVISNHITGLIMTQVAENRSLAPIFAELLDSEGSEIYLKPAMNYIRIGSPINIYTLSHLVSLREEVFLGYKKFTMNDLGKRTVDIILNPDKKSEIIFSEDDWLVVLAKS